MSIFSFKIPLLRSENGASIMSVQTKIEDEVSGIEFFVFVILIENMQFGAYGPVIIGATFSN